MSSATAKVDRAPARLQELQCTIKGRRESSQVQRSTGKAGTGGASGVRQEKVGGGHGGTKKRAETAGLGKENAGVAKKKKRRKKAAAAAAPVARRALGSRPSNANIERLSTASSSSSLSSLAPSSPSSSEAESSSGDSKRVHAAGSPPSAAGAAMVEAKKKREGRPPWSNYTGGAATARCASSYGDGGAARQASSYESGGGARPKSAAGKRRQQQGSGAVTPSQSRAKKPSMAQENRRKASAASTPTPLPSSSSPKLQSQNTVSDQRHTASRQRLHQGLQKDVPDYLHLPFPKTFHVDVRRPNPNRPWRLTAAPSPSVKLPRHSSSNPVVMFPNPAFVQHSLPAAKPAPFRSFQLKPLNPSSDFHPSPAATVRPYLSPSKQSPRQSLENPPTLSSNIDDLCSDGNRKPSRDDATLKNKKEKGWLTRRLSLPSSSASRRFSLLLPRRDEGSPAKPLPSLITRLPTRHLPKPASVHSLLGNSPASRLSRPKPLQSNNGGKGNGSSGNTAKEGPLSPLPLPPALRGTPTPAPSHKRSNSCPRQHFHGNSPSDHEAIVEKERGMSRRHGEPAGKENCNQGEGRSKLDCGVFPDCGATSVWPTVKRTWSFTHRNDATSKCTGAGPFLLKHMKAWVHNNKRAGFDVPKPMDVRRTS